MDYITLGMMAAEFRDACAVIDMRAADAEKDSLQSAWQASLSGDTAGRDAGVARAERAQEARKAAKLEAWLRIGEKHGLDRDEALTAYQRRQSIQ